MVIAFINRDTFGKKDISVPGEFCLIYTNDKRRVISTLSCSITHPTSIFIGQYQTTMFSYPRTYSSHVNTQQPRACPTILPTQFNHTFFIENPTCMCLAPVIKIVPMAITTPVKIWRPRYPPLSTLMRAPAIGLPVNAATEKTMKHVPTRTPI
jgi:hypothetical protein